MKNNNVINYKLDYEFYRVDKDDVDQRSYLIDGGWRVVNRKQRKLCKEQETFKITPELKKFFDSQSSEPIEIPDELLNELLEFDETSNNEE